MIFISKLIYDIGIFLFSCLARISALWNTKSSAWVRGRSQFPDVNFKGDRKRIWIHCASHGEFEQAKPLIEGLRNRHKDLGIVLSFFSPAGYEIGQNYSLVDEVIYLPLDTRRNARRITSVIKPALVIFIKYEFWINLLIELESRNIPTYLVSARFFERHPFFKWYGSLFRKVLKSFDHIFLQNDFSAELLKGIGIHNFTISGDTRMDRVIALASTRDEQDTNLFDSYKDRSVIVFGSIWPEDWDLIRSELAYVKSNFHMIIAPHEIHEKFVSLVESDIGAEDSCRYTDVKEKGTSNINDHMIVDTVGRLGILYRYGDIAYVGGGFGQGLHNILEPAAYGLPVLFGRDYKGFDEAAEMIDLEGGFSIPDKRVLKEVLYKMKNLDYRKTCGKHSKSYIYRSAGSTDQILDYLQTKMNANNEMG